MIILLTTKLTSHTFLRNYGCKSSFGDRLRKTLPEPLKVLKVIANYGEINGILTLHKIVYSLQNRGAINLNYKFLKYSFGPYSKELEEDLMMLKQLGLIVIEEKGHEAVIKLTKKGCDVIKNIASLKTE